MAFCRHSVLLMLTSGGLVRKSKKKKVLTQFLILLYFLAGSQEDLMLDLAGGRDDLHSPVDKPIYVSSIAKGSFLEGKLK